MTVFGLRFPERLLRFFMLGDIPDENTESFRPARFIGEQCHILLMDSYGTVAGLHFIVHQESGPACFVNVLINSVA